MSGALFSTLRDLNADVSAAYNAALAEARRDCGRGFFRSRGRWVCIVLEGNVIDPRTESEAWDWQGTRKALDELMAAHATRPEVVSISIEGGIDYAAALCYFDTGDYDPWVASWSVEIFRRGG